ncbi:MAG: DUF3597 family protein [Erythrobacter sp.]
MGIFASIKNAIWHAERGHAEEGARPTGAPVSGKSAPTPRPTVAAAPAPSAPQPALPDPISQTAMEERIARMPGASEHNWKTSIVDLMKMVGVDPSFDNRKDLADELGLEKYTGTAEQNIALHHAVLNLLAAEGGAMPDMLKN